MKAETRLLAALFFLAAPTAAIAQSADARVVGAIAARDAGRTQEAINRLEALARERPDDAVILRLLGTSYAAAQRYAAAADVLSRAQNLAPADQDIALARARTALWAQRFAEAAEILDRVAAVEPNNPELPQLRSAIRSAQSARHSFGLAAALGASRVRSRGTTQDWSDASIGLQLGLGWGRAASAEIEYFYRSGIADTRLSARLDHRIGVIAQGYIGASVTPSPDFRERWSLRGGGEARLGRTFALTLDARHAVYGTGGVTAIEPGLRVQTSDGRLSLAFRSINLWDEQGEHRNGWAGRANMNAWSNVAIFAGGASYPDTEAGVTRRVKALSAGSNITLAGGLDLRISAEREVRAQSYRRTGLAIGLRWHPGR